MCSKVHSIEVMEDLKNIRISAKADTIIEKLKDNYAFSTSVAVERFALSLALRDYKDEIDFDELDKVYSSDGTNQNTATIDTSDNLFQKLIQIIYPNCTTPYRYARVAIIYGLYKIDEMMSTNPNFSITEILKS